MNEWDPSSQQTTADRMGGRLQQQSLLLQPQANQHLQQPVQQQRTASGELSAYYAFSGLLDQRDIVWNKLQLLRGKYLHEMEQLYSLITSFDARSLNPDHALKLNHYKEVVQRMLTYLRVSKEKLPLEFSQELLEVFGKHIVMIIETFKRKPDAPAASQSSGTSAPQVDRNV